MSNANALRHIAESVAAYQATVEAEEATQRPLYCDRCGVEDRGVYARPGCECERVTVERLDGMRDYARPCGGILRAAEHLAPIEIRALKAQYRAEAVRMIRSDEALRIEREARELLRTVRAADLIPDVERDGSAPLIFGLVPPSAVVAKQPMTGKVRAGRFARFGEFSYQVAEGVSA